MVEVEIIKASYFDYKTMETFHFPWMNTIIRLDSVNPKTLLERLENGENLFKVVPGFTKEHLHNYPLECCAFLEREEIIYDEKEFLPENGFTQVGKSLIPYFNVFDRKFLEAQSRDSATHSSDRKIYVEALDEYPETNKFHKCFGLFRPYDSDDLVLTKAQLD